MLKTTAGSPPRAADKCSFLSSKAKLAVLQLSQAFKKDPILYLFDLECHTQIKIYTYDYAIGSILRQLTLESDQWHRIGFFSRKMISAEIR